jgi:hypothetical protein
LRAAVASAPKSKNEININTTNETKEIKLFIRDDNERTFDT